MKVLYWRIRNNKSFIMFKILAYYTFRMVCFVCMITFFNSCNSANDKKLIEPNLANKWALMTIYITQHTPSNTPTNASRSLGYIGLAMYESIVAGYPDYNSIADQLNGLKPLEKPNPTIKYNWEISLNAGQSYILKNIYNQTSDLNKQKIDSLEKAIEESIVLKEKDDKAASIKYGVSIAKAIFEWSKADGGHKGYLKNFDKSMQMPPKPGSWKPPLYAQSFSHFPLHPHWGDNRTFLKENANIDDPKFIAFNSDPNSEYYKQFLEVYKKEKVLNQAEKEAAIWWGDDPDETPTPPGHSYFLASLVLNQKKPKMIVYAETYAKVGMGLSDAFRNCWKWKYKYSSERPNTFITEHIDNQWVSFWPDPPFPSFPSGHAIQASTTAVILTDLFGPTCNITDITHLGRKRDEIRNVDFKTRKFTSFWQIAEETANSRFYGGIHTKQDNEAGLLKGKEIGQNIIALRWKK